MLVRGGSLRAGMSDYLVRGIEDADNVRVRTNACLTGGGGEGHLEHLTVEDSSTGSAETVPADALFVLIGAASPAPNGCRRRSGTTGAASSSPARISCGKGARPTAGSGDACPRRLRPACPACSRQETCAIARSSGWPRPSEKAPPPSSRSTNT